MPLMICSVGRGTPFGKMLRRDRHFCLGEAKRTDLAIPNFAEDRQQMLRDRGDVSDGYFVVGANALGRGCFAAKYASIAALGRMSVRVRRRNDPLELVSFFGVSPA